MKIFENVLFAIIFILIVSSCGGKKSEKINSKSADNKIGINIVGIKNSFADPFNVSLQVKGYGHDEVAEIEIFAQDLNKENVKFEWKSNDACAIIFHQQDETTRSIFVEVDPNSINIHE